MPEKKQERKSMIKLILIIALLYSGIVLLFYFAQRQLIYFPSQYAPKPQDVGVGDMQVVSLHTSDNITLKAWYRPQTIAHKPTIVYLHGNAGGIGHRAMQIQPFLRKGYGVLLVSWRGYSQNPSYPTEQGLYNDAEAAIDFLQKQGVKPKCLVLYGESIGCAVAIEMATKYPVGALILLSPFTSLVDIGSYHYPFLPISWLFKDRYNSLKKARDVQTPTLIIHGENDHIVPPQFGQKLFEAMNEPKEMRLVRDRGHNDLFELGPVMQFIDERVHCE